MSSARFSKLEVDIEIRAPAERFFEVHTRKTYMLSNTSPDKVVSCELLEGDWGKEGSVISWNYVIDGNARVGKELLEAVDIERNSVTYRVIDGYLLQYYKSFKRSCEATPKGKGEEEGTRVHWTLEYEKLHDKVPEPHPKLQFILDLVKDFDAHPSSQEHL
ncbi:putative START-like domain-containing protein [Rosa chinensis]|uniref:Putative START-like domain-containing protein n=1 Tax=Rosa chinensis TaxID=74649 RepID=A0A2P6QQS5_ROSCH|nr:MLP-like protein 31 [Rosa chinensis]PRQ36531.1 putative START-like domain-containing protein [Rosa chinensis]